MAVGAGGKALSRNGDKDEFGAGLPGGLGW
jgi:hypothetical protein